VRKKSSRQSLLQYVLLSLVELSQGLTATGNIFRAVDALLLNLMGQLGTTRAMLWLVADEPPGHPALIRSHGFKAGEAERLSRQSAVIFLEAVRSLGALTPESPGGAHPDGVGARIESSGLALVAPIWASEALLGMLALGARADGARYTAMDVELLAASLGMAGIALQNIALHHQLLESQRRLRIANEGRIQLEQLEDEFLANINHELRTPLTVIVPALEHVLESNPTPDELQVLVAGSITQARRLIGHIENLLTLSEIGQNTLSLRIVDQDVMPLLESYYRERLPGVSASLRELIFEPSKEPLSARFDEKRLSQVLDALVDNAVKFTPPGSRIVLSADALTQGDHSWVRIRVEDNGPGIPAENLDTLFEPFRQLDGSATRRVGGLGIGLALARDLASRMGGDLTATSQQDGGSSFIVLLRR